MNKDVAQETIRGNTSQNYLLYPKADLHVHFEGTVTSDVLAILSRNSGIDIFEPIQVGQQLLRFPPGTDFEQKQFSDFRSFICRYLRITSLIRSPREVEMIGRAYLESASKQKITASELYFSPSTYPLLGIDVETLFVGLSRLSAIAKEEFSSSIAWIFDIVRNSQSDPQWTVDVAVEARKQGVNVKAIGLAGAELAAPAERFSEAFKQARMSGFETLAHAGEGTTPDEVKDVLRYLEPSRIGHGVSAAEDEDCLKQIRERKIPLEVCPWSNIALGHYSEANHPLPRLIESGVPVVICSDDPGIFDKTLLDNYELAQKLGVSQEQLKSMADLSCLLALG